MNVSPPVLNPFGCSLPNHKDLSVVHPWEWDTGFLVPSSLTGLRLSRRTVHQTLSPCVYQVSLGRPSYLCIWNDKVATGSLIDEQEVTFLDSLLPFLYVTTPSNSSGDSVPPPPVFGSFPKSLPSPHLGRVYGANTCNLVVSL